VPDSTTFWLANGRVSKVFEVSRLGSRTYEACVLAFQKRVAQVESALGRPPSVPAAEPSWAKGMSDAQKLALVGQGQLGLNAIWRFPRRELSVRHARRQGHPVLVVGLTPAAPACDPQNVAFHVDGSFPARDVDGPHPGG